MEKINIILPCAGLGTRLGLPYPKETHMIAENTALIDLTFQSLLKGKQYIDAVTVILAPEKGILLEHLKKWSSEFYIRFCYFNDNYNEWAGSVLSAEPDFHEKNVVLLPDSYIVENSKNAILPTFDRLLSKHSSVFACKLEEDKNMLRNLGALTVKDGIVTSFCDKPTSSYKKYNAFWCSFGFQKEAGRPLLEMMMNSIQKEPVNIQDICPSNAAFFVDDYKDLGTWPSLRELVQELRFIK